MLLVQRIFPSYRPHMSFLRASPLLQSFVWREISPRTMCQPCDVIYIFIIKEPLDALSAAIWPCSRWKKIPVTSFVCRQNHFSRLIRPQTNNYCYFLLDWFFVSVALMPSGKPFLKVAKKIPRQPTTRVEVNLIRVLISNWHTERIMEGMKSVFLGGMKGRWGG